MLTHFLDLLAAVISVTSLLIVTYGALIGIISFLKNEIRRFTCLLYTSPSPRDTR